MKNEIIKIKRKLIADAAKKLFYSSSYENTSMNEIAEEAGITKPTLYVYFKNKEEIYMYVFLRESIKRWEYIKNALDKHISCIDKLYAYGKAYYEYHQNNPQELKLAMYWQNYGHIEYQVSPEIKSEFYENTQKARIDFSQILEMGVRNKELRSDIDIKTAGVFIPVTLRTMMNEIIVLGYYSPDYYFNFLETLISGLKNYKNSENISDDLGKDKAPVILDFSDTNKK